MKTLYRDATVVPMTGEDVFYKYIGVENGRISYLGNEDPDSADAYDRVISLNGRFVYPTLTDSHLHLLYSIVLGACSFNICRMTERGVEPACLSDIGRAVREYADANPGNGLIMINQYIASAMQEKRLPYSCELDGWTKGREAVLFNIDGHSCSLSSALQKKLKVKTKDGILQGEEYDMNQGKITSYAASAVDLPMLARGIAAFTNQCLEYGITRVCALDGDDTGSFEKEGLTKEGLTKKEGKNRSRTKDPLLELLVILARRMDIDIRLFPEYMDFSVLKRFGRKMLKPRIGGCGRWELDGSVGSHSAVFPRPFRDTNTLGKLYHRDEAILQKVKDGLTAGIQMSAHAIGTVAIDQLAGAYEKNQELIPESGPMPRIDHFEFPSRKAIDFVKKNRIAVTVQPGFSYLDKRCIHSYECFLDPEDLKRIVPLKELADAGVKLLGSSDSPVQSVNPYEQMRGMMEYYDPSQSLSAYQALETYTCNAALALGEEGGILKTGGPADFFVSRQDILHSTADEILKVRADEVYLRGRKLCKKKGTLAEFIIMLLKKPKKI